MQQNIILKKNEHKLVSKKEKKQPIEPKIFDMMMRRMEEAKKKRPFEEMPALLGMSPTAFVASQYSNDYYTSR